MNLLLLVLTSKTWCAGPGVPAATLMACFKAKEYKPSILESQQNYLEAVGKRPSAALPSSRLE
jgi:hypothetical protein